MDPDTWDWEMAEVGVTVGEPGTTITMEFSRHEHRDLAHAAGAKGISTLAVIKRSALATARANASHAQQPGATKHAATC